MAGPGCKLVATLPQGTEQRSHYSIFLHLHRSRTSLCTFSRKPLDWWKEYEDELDVGLERTMPQLTSPGGTIENLRGDLVSPVSWYFEGAVMNIDRQ